MIGALVHVDVVPRGGGFQRGSVETKNALDHWLSGEVRRWGVALMVLPEKAFLQERCFQSTFLLRSLRQESKRERERNAALLVKPLWALETHCAKSTAELGEEPKLAGGKNGKG